MSGSVSWLTEASQVPAALTDEIRAELGRPDGSVHRLYQALAPMPSMMLPADRFYRAVLHAPDAPLVLHEAEFVATHVAILNACTYARAHHGENFLATAPDRTGAEAALQALAEEAYGSPALSDRQRAMARYTAKLTREPAGMTRADVEALDQAGLSPSEIVHVNQIAASFNYWTRMINGLGITLGDEAVGLGEHTLDGITAGRGAE